MSVEGMVVIALVLAAFLIVGIQFAITNKATQKRRRFQLRKEWGKAPEREYEAEEIRRISAYFYYTRNKGKVTDPYIDDITWNDLDMDRIFMRLNQTHSSAGEEYLYYLLRVPKQERESLENLERLIDFFGKQEEEREKLQLTLMEVGRTRKFSISDYIDNLISLEKESNVRHYLALLTIPAGLLIMGLGILPMETALMVLIAGCVWNIVSYYKRKAEIDPYITTFQYILKILQAVKEMEKVQIPEIEPYRERLLSAAKRFDGFRRGSYLLMASKKATGDLADMILDYVRMLTHLDLLKFNGMLENVKQNADTIDVFIENFGILESAISIASFRKSLPYYTVPELKETKEAFLQAEELYHPLIAQPVANSISETRNVLITGSNASGKSTFLKTVAINATLAQTIHTCAAKHYRAPYFQIYSSMALKDSLETKESYFIVEIKSLKRILEHAEDAIPVLCFVDEVLRGTNTVERISASAHILEHLVKDNVLCFAATHDIELTHLLEESYGNYHFQEEIRDGDVSFNYELKEGRAVSRNAIRLLSMLGYEEDMIRKAEETAANFMKTGEWKL